MRPETVRSGLPSSQQRTSIFRATERDLHEVLFFLIFHRCAHHRISSRVQWTRRPHRIRLFLRALVLDRSWFPSALSHISASLKRTWDQKLSIGLMGCQLKLAITGYHFHVALDCYFKRSTGTHQRDILSQRVQGLLKCVLPP